MPFLRLFQTVFAVSLLFGFVTIAGAETGGQVDEGKPENLLNCSKGQAAFNAKKYELSAKFYSLCIKSGNLSTHFLDIAYQERGIAYSRARQMDKAISDFNETLKIRPKNAEVLSERGQAWAAKRNFDQAIRDYTAALEINQKLVKTIINRGLMYDALGNLDAAERDFKKAYALGSRWKPMLEKLKKYSATKSNKSRYEVTWNLPKGFKLAHKNENEDQRMYQYTPEGETVKNWGQMITLGILKLKQSVPNIARMYTESTLKGFQAPCGSSETISIKLPPTKIPFISGASLCSDLDISKVPSHIYSRKNGFIFVKTFSTAEVIYTFQYEWQDNNNPPSFVKTSGLLNDVIIPMMETAEVRYVEK